MNSSELLELIGLGETSAVQFKSNVHNENSIAQEMVAFANSKGGRILIGIDDKTWEIIGLTDDDIRRLTNLLVNAANEHVKSPVFIETETIISDGKKVIVVFIPEGTDKPYKDKDGLIFMKNGANKRKVTNNEELSGLLSKGRHIFPDEMAISEATIGDINKEKFEFYFTREFKSKFDHYGLTYEEALRVKKVERWPAHLGRIAVFRQKASGFQTGHVHQGSCILWQQFIRKGLSRQSGFGWHHCRSV